MEPNPVVKEFFIVLRGKSRKGFCRGCIGRLEAETQNGEMTGLLYPGGPNAGSPKNGGVVRREDTYLLTRHQAQLLLYVSSVSKRLELLCNPQLFSAICELNVDDLVVVKNKKGHKVGLVRNLMPIGKESKGDLQMLAFEVEFLDSDQTSKKPAPPSLFSAVDIIQVVPAYSVPLGLNCGDGQYGGTNKKAVTRINSMANIGTNGRVQANHTQQSIIQSPNHSTPLEVGSLAQVVSNTGVTVYGVVRWLGVPAGKTAEWAGIELDYDVKGCSDGTYGGQRLFTCKISRALFLPVTKCNPDSRFDCFSAGGGTPNHTEIPTVPPYVDSDEYVAPIPESEAMSLLVGRMKGIQGHINSCYLDATLFRQGFVPAASVMNFRNQLGCDTFRTEEKDPEEFITVLFQKVLGIEPLLKLRSRGESYQGAYTLQIILEKEQMAHTPTVQQLMDTSCLSCDVKFEEMPSCLIVQMPRFGNKYKMFSHIIPSVELDITDLLHNSPRQCFICGQLAEYDCLQCLPDHKMHQGRIKSYCTTCNTQVHTHPSRQAHFPKRLSVSAEVSMSSPAARHTMQLFAVLCIHTSHYVSFVKFGSDPHSWLFFDSMADRHGDDKRGFNIPEIKACPELGNFLSQSEEEQARVNPLDAPELVRRLLCDSYMLLYQNPAMPLSNSNHQDP
ncbi:ubiquitin carboxyl-terminal hydrolase CYLD isoform X2 [Nerophis ophidion]|uniref:ubiquitin carboxyl-terminal hydrolase CYLD isoform X2 n=1 Tax=Nerophis ophidion TaxID=159077 RepID=UPI002ADF1B7B|nr:ubiquitin carboxyl-terminal hydrolase CYLD isoform X2 [Nerophis ophidion]